MMLLSRPATLRYQCIAGALVAAFTPVSPVAKPPAVREPVSIPFTTTPDGFVLVPATADRTTTMQLILDTGAGLDVLAPSRVGPLVTGHAGEYTGFRMWGDRVDLSLYTLGELAVGPFVRRDVTVAEWQLLDKMHVDGIISARDFRDQPFTLDFAHRRLILETAASLAQRKRHAHRSPITLDDYHGTALDLLARVRLAGDSGECVLDTGSPTSTINSRYLTAFHVDTTDSAVGKRETRTTTGESVRRYVATIPALALAAAPEVSQIRPRVSFANIIYDCVVGIDFWAGRAVTFDIPDRELLVSDVETAR